MSDDESSGHRTHSERLINERRRPRHVSRRLLERIDRLRELDRTSRNRWLPR